MRSESRASRRESDPTVREEKRRAGERREMGSLAVCGVTGSDTAMGVVDERDIDAERPFKSARAPSSLRVGP